MTFGDYVTSRVGHGWVVAHRLTPRLKAKLYAVAVKPEQLRALELEWAKAHPAAVLDRVNKIDLALLRAAGLLREPDRMDPLTDALAGLKSRLASA